MMPLRSLPRLLALLAALVLAACAAPPVRDGVYPLRPEQSVALAPGLTLTYDSFSDSRCPPNAECVWAGRLVFRFVVEGPDGREEFSLGPDQPAATPAALHGARVALDVGAIPPARVSGASRPGDVLPVTLRILTHPSKP